MADKKIKDFLERIKQIESSGGKNFNHPEITLDNLQKGDRAIGNYGLMPNTVKEIISRKRLKNEVTPEMVELYKLSPDVLKQTLEKNPNIEQHLAEELAKHSLEKQEGNEEKAAYSWLKGHNLNPEQITPEILDDSNYVQKYRNLRSLMAPQEDSQQLLQNPNRPTPEELDEEIKKAYMNSLKDE